MHINQKQHSASQVRHQESLCRHIILAVSQCPSLKQGDQTTRRDERYGRKEGVNEGGKRRRKMIRRLGKEEKHEASCRRENVSDR